MTEVNEAGAKARKKAQDFASQRSTGQRLVDRVLDRKTDERNWRRGAEGEERTAKSLRRLPDSWFVAHDVTVGKRGANIDHIVIGPNEIWVIDSKNLKGDITVNRRSIQQNGHRTKVDVGVSRQAKLVSEKLSLASGLQVEAKAVLSIKTNGSKLIKTKHDHEFVNVHHVEGLAKKLVRSAGDTQRYTLDQMALLYHFVLNPSTWLGETKSVEEPEPVIEPTAEGPASDVTDIILNVWKKFGHYRVYATDAQKSKLGYLDVETSELHDIPEGRDDVKFALESWKRD